MRIIPMFHTLVVLMVVLTFSTSFATLAQQNPVLTEVSKTAAQNANAVAEAKAAAERDASKDTNEPAWFCIGGPTLLFGFLYGFMGGHMILNASEYTGGLVIDFEEYQARVCGVGSLALGASCIGIVGRGIFAETPPPTNSSFLRRRIMPGIAPPPDRLIGKSPEYVESYLNAYKRKVRTLRGVSTVTGSGAVCLSIFGLAVANID